MGKFLHAFFSPLGLRRAVPQVWDGFQTNIKLMVIAEILVLVLALVVAIVRGLPGRWSLPFRGLAIGYTDFFRGTPLILVAYVIALGLPSLKIAVISSQSLFVYGIAALTLVYTAYVTEVYRAGIESVHPSQEAAARLQRFVVCCVRRGRGRQVRRADPRRADRRRAEPEEEGCVRRRGRADRHARGLRRDHGEGQRAEAVRRQGDQGAQGKRDDRQAAAEMAAVHPCAGPDVAV